MPTNKAVAKTATTPEASLAKAAKKSSKKAATPKYSPAASKSIETEMKAMEAGKLKSGKSGKKVTNPKQAIAIGLSKARKAGAKMPPPPES